MTYVIHVASPYPAQQPKDESELITPAVEGTQAILKACVQAKSVKKVVLTSSSVAVCCKFVFPLCLFGDNQVRIKIVYDCSGLNKFVAFFMITHTYNAIGLGHECGPH